MASTILAYTTVASLLLAQVGPESLPMSYILIGLCSIPVSAGFSQIIDHWPRLRLFQGLLWVAAGLAIGLRVLIFFDWAGAYYAAYISYNLLELLLYIILWTLLSDYFTSLELKRYTIFLSMATTIGGLLGGLLARLLSDILATQNCLLVLPVLYLGAIVQLLAIGRATKALQFDGTQEEIQTFGASLRSFPRLLKRYPIVPLLAINMLLAVLVWQISELQFLGIYSATFPDQEDLAGFLGLLSACLGMAELGITYYITQPLIQHWGVSRMNLAYPLTSLVSFVGLLFSFQLSSAIVLNLNYDTLSNSLAQPIQNLTYNAIPHRFIGRVRVIIDGLIYPACQAIVGVLLLLQQGILSPQQLTLAGIAVSLLFLGSGYLTGRGYLGSLLGLLRAGSINFGDVDEGLVRLPEQYAREVTDLLHSADPGAQLLGLELAARLDNPSQFLPDVQHLLTQTDGLVRQAIVQFLNTRNHPQLSRYLRTQLTSDNRVIRAAVLEALITSQQPLSSVQLLYFLEDPDPEIRALAYVATERMESKNPEVQRASQQARPSLTLPTAREAIVRVISTLRDRSLIPLLSHILPGASATIKREALEVLTQIAPVGDEIALELALEELTHPNPTVRAAAIHLLGVIQAPRTLALVVKALEDPEPLVRRQAAGAASAYGENCLPLIRSYLVSTRSDWVEAAISAIGQVRTRRAEDLLFQALQSDYYQVAVTLNWQQQVPQEPSWNWLAIALQDYHDRVLHRMFAVLSALGSERTILEIRNLLNSGSVHSRANAIETLISLKYRRFVQPILPLLEYLALADPSVPPPPPLEFALEILSFLGEDSSKGEDHPWQIPLKRARSRWVRVGAIMALPGDRIPTRLSQDPDPVIQALAAHSL
ncbi:MAG: HEAT repeat domain-containing protein, partial [Leptolyngbyaceae cyanobacterium bins.59]|nr:HEAT repeat domain-containing protein [Leptolyngbyaceae cyanobacterium bins.59]